MVWLRFLLVAGKIDVLFESWIYLTSVRKDFLSTDADGTRGATSVFLQHKTRDIGCGNSISFCLLDRCCSRMCAQHVLRLPVFHPWEFPWKIQAYYFCQFYLTTCIPLVLCALDLLVCVLSVFVSVPIYIYHDCVRVIFARDPIPSKGTMACAVRICLSVIEVIDCRLRCTLESAERALHWQMPFHSLLCTYHCYSGWANKHTRIQAHTSSVSGGLAVCLLN